jgi:hypothetical protein
LNSTLQLAGADSSISGHVLNDIYINRFNVKEREEERGKNKRDWKMRDKGMKELKVRRFI